MNLVMPRAINCEFITVLNKTTDGLTVDLNYSELRTVREKLKSELQEVQNLQAKLVDRRDSFTLITSSVRFYREAEPTLRSFLAKLEDARRKMRSADRMKLIDSAIRALEFRLKKLRELEQFIDPLHLAVQRHLLAFVTPLRSMRLTQEHLYRLIDARDEFFRSNEEAKLNAYLETLESLREVIPRDTRVAFKQQYDATAEELAELEAAAMIAFA